MFGKSKNKNIDQKDNKNAVKKPEVKSSQTQQNVANKTQSEQQKTQKAAPKSPLNQKTKNSVPEKQPPKLKIKSWYANRYQMVVVQRNILLLFTLSAMVAVTVAVIFVRNIMASKSLEPYVIEVEKKTGVPVVVQQLTAQHLTGDQMIRKYFINKYIHGASGYDPKTYKLDANVIRLFSTPRVYSQFRRRINAKELGPNSSIEVRIKSVQFPNPNTAQIRLVRQIRQEGFETVVKNEIITMDFYFADIDLSLEERLVNPLGFQVSRYLVSEEIYNY